MQKSFYHWALNIEWNKRATRSSDQRRGQDQNDLIAVGYLFFFGFFSFQEIKTREKGMPNFRATVFLAVLARQHEEQK